MQTVKDKIFLHNDLAQKESRRKRLGQFFTGERLARLLFSLASVPRGASVIDPMCGTGDMLKAARYIDSTAVLSGVEIDGSILRQAQHELSDARLLTGSAFNPNLWRQADIAPFDLVITNPPYVRYQNLGKFNDDLNIPNAKQVRNGLREIVGLLVDDKEDKKLFTQLVDEYSGLSDLAVPSCILSVLLTKCGGTLALVVPESWLSRDYADILHYMISRWFKVRYIVEDTHAQWFPDVLVKTVLLVADRIKRRHSAFHDTDDRYVHVRLASAASSPDSMVGNLYNKTEVSERLFAKELLELLNHQESRIESAWSAQVLNSRHLSGDFLRASSQKAWISRLEPESKDYKHQTNGTRLPVELVEWLGRNVVFNSLENEGVSVGQGLRTGANIFFYSDCVKESGGVSTIAPNPSLGLGHLKINSDNFGTVLCRQSELPEGYRIKKRELKSRVLLLKGGRVGAALKKLIDRGAHLTIKGTLVPNLSAVKTNVKWYSLPPLTWRHIPDLLIPRVNGEIPRTYLNDQGVIVDANFSTFWISKSSRWNKPALLAFLNSTWASVYMELAGAVMGGGALKLEATHIKKLPVPAFTKEEISELSSLGKELALTGDLRALERVDSLIAHTLLGKTTRARLAELKSIAQRRVDERKHRS